MQGDIQERAVLQGDPPVEILLRPNARARRFSLRVAAADGRVTLSFPPAAGRAAALAFARDREGWLRARLAERPPEPRAEPGSRLPFAGEALLMVAAPLRRARREGAVLLVPPGRAAGRAAADFLRDTARIRLTHAAGLHAAQLGRRPGRITLRDPRSRWGSCTVEGNLMFSWRLAMAPVPVLDYVAAHEVAHLVEMNHGPAFWALVAQLCPGYGLHQGWLRRHGAALQAWRFAVAPDGD